MKFMRIGPVGGERSVVEFEGQWFALDEELAGEFWNGGPERVREAARTGALQPVEVAGERVGHPVARPQAVVCIGMNYAAHAAESGAQPPERPIIFFKTPNTLAGPDDDLVLPPGSTRTDWEVELAVIIGRPAWQLTNPEDALACVAGYALANDLSERELQLDLSGGQWSKGKCCPGFLPLGPWVATPDEVDASNLGLRSWVNGEVRQDSRTSDMVFDVPTIIQTLSTFMRLEPGDIILTGTPQGVALSGRFPYLAAGDVVELEADGLGRQRQTCHSA